MQVDSLSALSQKIEGWIEGEVELEPPPQCQLIPLRGPAQV